MKRVYLGVLAAALAVMSCDKNDPNYSKQAREDLHDVSDLIRKYLLTLLNYKGNYYLSRD